MRHHRVALLIRLLLTLLFVLPTGAAFLARAAASAQQASANAQEARVTELKPDQVIERKLAGGEVHTYQVNLAAGEFLHLVATQRGINLAIALFDPAGKQLIEVNSVNDTLGFENAFWRAAASGSYRLEVRPQDKRAKRAGYDLKIAAQRAAQASDEKIIAAQNAFSEGQQLRAQGKAETLRSAIEKYQAALAAWRAAGDRNQEAETLLALGLTHSQLGEKPQALDYYLKSLPLRQAVGDRFGEGKTLSNIGAIYNDLGQRPQALAYLKQALPLRRQVGDARGEATTLLNIGGVHNETGEKELALDYFQQVLATMRRLEDRGGEANLLINIGAVYSVVGEKQQALDHYHQALPLLREVKDRRREAIVLNGIGSVYAEMGDRRRASDYRHQALAIIREVGDRSLEANLLNSLGLAHVAAGEARRGIEFFNQALTLSRTIGDRLREANALTSLGFAYAELGEKQRALDLYHQALAMHRAAGNRRAEANALDLRGRVYTELNQLQQAAECFAQVLPIWRSIGDRAGEAMSLFNSAKLEKARGNLAAARSQVEAAIARLEALRASVAIQDLRSSFFAGTRDYFDLQIDLLMQLAAQQPAAGHHLAAFLASERGRARSLLDLLAEARAELRREVPAELVDRQRRLQQRVNDLAARSLQLKANRRTEPQAAALDKELDALTTELQHVQAAMRQQNPRYAALTQPPSFSLAEIQAQLDADTLLLEYALGQERSYLWAVTQNSITSYVLPPRAEIEAVAQQVYAELSAAPASAGAAQRDLRPVPSSKPAAEAATRLSQMLLGPLAAQLRRQRLVVVADGVLHYLPFGALPMPSARRAQRPLLADHEIVSLPSAATLLVLRRELAQRQPAPKTVAVLADPVFDLDDGRVSASLAKAAPRAAAGTSNAPASVADSNRARWLERFAERAADADSAPSFPRLRFTRQEAERILALTPPDRRMKALDFRANRALATAAELSQYRYLHFATHGYLDAERPELSALVLSLVDEQGAPMDGFLRTHEIYNLNLPAELVVLSACRTGLGKQIKSEGLVGLTRGFMYAGAARVVVSLWGVNDQATAELMARFYQKMLKQELRPAAALRAAQIEMWQQARWRAPYYWAAFTLQGEWR